MSNEDLRRLLDAIEQDPKSVEAWKSLERSLRRMGYKHVAYPIGLWTRLAVPVGAPCFYCHRPRGKDHPEYCQGCGAAYPETIEAIIGNPGPGGGT